MSDCKPQSQHAGRTGGPEYSGFLNVLVATKFRKYLEQLQPETVLGGRWRKPAAKPKTESMGPLWHGIRIPRPCQGTPQSPEAQHPHQKCSTGSTKGKHRARTADQSIQKGKSPFSEMNSIPGKSHKKPISSYHQPEKFPGSHKSRPDPLIVLQPGPCFPPSAALQLQGFNG